MKIKSRALIKIMIIVPFLLLVYILQATVCSRVQIFGAKPLILPLAAVAVAISEGSIKGGAYGIITGMLCDISFNQSTIQFTLALTLVGIVVGIAAEAFLVKNFTTYLLCSLITLVFCGFVQALPMLIFNGVPIHVLIGVSIRQIMSSILFTLPIYYIFRIIDPSPRF